MLKILLIGGTNGGRTVEVEGGIKSIRLPALRKGFQREVGGAPRVEQYYLGEISDSSGERHSVLVHDGEDAIRVLLNHYQNG